MPCSTRQTDAITGAILAGGQGRRMGGADKGLLELADRPLIEHVIADLRPQVAALLISANRHLDRYARHGINVIPDTHYPQRGPLAGIYNAMLSASTPLILTAPCDGPVLPSDYARRMLDSMIEHRADVCIAHDGTRLQPTYALISCALSEKLDAYLASGHSKTRDWLTGCNHVVVDFSDQAAAFININTPADYLQAKNRRRANSSSTQRLTAHAYGA